MSAANIELGSLVQILGDHLDGAKKKAILEDIKKLLDEEAQSKQEENNKEKPPKIPKKKVVILTSIPDGITEKQIEDFTGFITEIAEDEPTRELKSAVRKVKQDYQGTRKALKKPADSLSELFENAGGPLFKEHGIYKKPAGPLEFIYLPNRSA
jgi:hypothetical protein